MTPLVLLLALAAPAPAIRPPVVPAIKPGTYLMRWQGTDCETVFHADGFFACRWLGTWWHGQWKQEKGELTVEEWPMASPALRYRWSVRLSCPATGTLSGIHPWKLAPPDAGPET